MVTGKIVLVIASIIFLFLLTSSVSAQMAVGDSRCPDKCERSTLYQGGYYDEKLRVCIYKTEIPCKYDCRILDEKVITEPACNVLPPESTATSLEMIYAQMRKEFLDTAKPTPTMYFHGTEYLSGKQAKAWLQLLDPVNAPIDNSLCYIHIFTPIGTQFLGKTTMTHISEGIYNYDFTVPMEEGVYPMIAECYYNATQNMTYMTDYWTVTGWSSYYTGSIANTYVDDTSYLTLREEEPTGVVPWRFNGGFNISQMCQPEEAISKGITIYWGGFWDSVPNDDLTISIWNYTSGTWLDFPNEIISQTDFQIVTNSLTSFVNLTKAGLTNSTNGGLKIKFGDISMTDGARSSLRTDIFWTSCDEMSGLQWQTVRGSSEMHVTSTTAYSHEVDSVIPVLNNTGLLGGFIGINFTVYSGSYINMSDVEVDIPLPYLLDCSEIIYLKRYNGTITNVNYTTSWDSSTENCIISFTEDMVQGGYGQYEVRIQNEWARSQEKQYMEMMGRDMLYSVVCEAYRVDNGLPAYQVPVNSTLPLNDTFYGECNYYLDTAYRLGDTYTSNNADYALITNLEQLKHHETLVQEWNVRYERLKNIGSIITDSLETIHDYSSWILANIPQSYSLAGVYLANRSASNVVYQWLIHNSNQSSIMNYLAEINQTTHNNNQSILLAYLIDMNNTIHSLNDLSAGDVWGYATRTLTDYNQSGMITMLISINDTQNANHQSVMSMLAQINNSLFLQMENINGSIMGRFTVIDDKLDKMNETLLNRTEYLFNITSIIQNNVTSVSGDLQYAISILESLATENVTNMTFDWTDLYESMRNLFFSGGIVGVEAQEMGNATCISDDILRRTIDSTGSVNNDTLVTSKTYDTYCEYGCSRGSCRLPPYYYAGALLVVIAIMGVIYMLWSRRQETIIYR